jgi:hypothetical protein
VATGDCSMGQTFEGISTRDEKTHLHVVEKHEVPEFLLGIQPSSS